VLDNIRADLQHYSRYCYQGKSIWRILFRLLYVHPASTAVIWYRFGSAAWRTRIPILRQLLQFIYLLFWPLIRLYSGVQILPTTQIGPGIVILHYGGVVIAEDVRIGENCLLHHNVSIVTMRNRKGAQIGNNFYAGVGIIIIGTITIEDNVIAGAGCIITKSVPQNAVVAGIPAKIIRFREPDENPVEGKTLRPQPVGWLVYPENSNLNVEGKPLS
jgi:serine O-acetyltransferase